MPEPLIISLIMFCCGLLFLIKPIGRFLFTVKPRYRHYFPPHVLSIIQNQVPRYAGLLFLFASVLVVIFWLLGVPFNPDAI